MQSILSLALFLALAAPAAAQMRTAAAPLPPAKAATTPESSGDKKAGDEKAKADKAAAAKKKKPDQDTDEEAVGPMPSMPYEVSGRELIQKETEKAADEEDEDSDSPQARAKKRAREEKEAVDAEMNKLAARPRTLLFRSRPHNGPSAPVPELGRASAQKTRGAALPGFGSAERRELAAFDPVTVNRTAIAEIKAPRRAIEVIEAKARPAEQIKAAARPAVEHKAIAQGPEQIAAPARRMPLAQAETASRLSFNLISRAAAAELPKQPYSGLAPAFDRLATP